MGRNRGRAGKPALVGHYRCGPEATVPLLTALSIIFPLSTNTFHFRVTFVATSHSRQCQEDPPTDPLKIRPRSSSWSSSNPTRHALTASATSIQDGHPGTLASSSVSVAQESIALWAFISPESNQSISTAGQMNRWLQCCAGATQERTNTGRINWPRAMCQTRRRLKTL